MITWESRERLEPKMDTLIRKPGPFPFLSPEGFLMGVFTPRFSFFLSSDSQVTTFFRPFFLLFKGDLMRRWWRGFCVWRLLFPFSYSSCRISAEEEKSCPCVNLLVPSLSLSFLKHLLSSLLPLLGVEIASLSISKQLEEKPPFPSLTLGREKK